MFKNYDYEMKRFLRSSKSVINADWIDEKNFLLSAFGIQINFFSNYFCGYSIPFCLTQ